MRFCSGAPPIDENFAPEAAGWQPLRGRDTATLEPAGLLMAFVIMVFVAVVFHRALPEGLRPTHRWVGVLALALTVPAHELTHALLTPGWGMTPRTLLGIQQEHGVPIPYAYYEGPQTRGRKLLTAIAPFLLFTVVACLLAILGMGLSDDIRSGLSFLAFFNGALSGSDLASFTRVLTQVPTAAEVQMHGRAIYWRVAPSEVRAVSRQR